VPPTPNIPPPTTTVLKKIERPALNNNAHTFSEGKHPNDRPQTIGSKPGGTIDKPQSVSKENIDFRPSSPATTKPNNQVSPRPSAKPSTPSNPVTPRPSTPSSPKPSVPAIKSGKG
jgi:hypothetical protein